MPDHPTTALVKTPQSPALARVSNQLALTDKIIRINLCELYKKLYINSARYRVGEYSVVCMPFETFNKLSCQRQTLVVNAIKEFYFVSVELDYMDIIGQIKISQSEILEIKSGMHVEGDEITQELTLCLEELIVLCQEKKNVLKEEARINGYGELVRLLNRLD